MTQSAIKPTRKPVTIEAKKAAPSSKAARNPSHDEITQRARALWEAKGCPAGRDEEIWLEAETQLRNGN